MTPVATTLPQPSPCGLAIGPRLRFAAVGLWLLATAICAGMAIAKPTSHTVYPIYSATARAWLAGEPLYVHVPGYDFYRYSPTCAAMLTVLLPFGEGGGGAVWRVLGALLLAASLVRWFRIVEPQWGRDVEGLGLLLMTPFLVQNLYNGQVNTHLTALLVFGFVFLHERRLGMAAAALAAAILIKPYVIAVAGLLILVEPRLAARLVAALAIGVGLAFLLQSPGYVFEQHVDWFRHFTGNDRIHLHVRSHYRDLALVYRQYVGPLDNRIYLAACAVVGLGLAGLVWRCRPGLRAAFGLGCVWVTAFGPATESCTYVLLGPTLVAEVLTRRGPAGFWPRFVYAVYFGTALTAVFPNDWQIQILGPQPLAGAILAVDLVSRVLHPSGPIRGATRPVLWKPTA